MRKKLFIFLEIIGIVISFVTTLLLWNIYEFSNRAFVSTLFGSVNYSIWEQMKVIIFSYIFFGLIELIYIKPYFKQYVVAKFIGLYVVLLLYIALRSLYLREFDIKMNLLLGAISIIVGYFISCILTLTEYSLEGLFPTACFMILLLFLLCFTFTAFPQKGELFRDPLTDLYGIIPWYIDVGAIVLNQMYF